MSPPHQLRQQTSNCSSLLIYGPRKDERLSWPSWLACSGWLTHISGHPSARSRAQDSESTSAKDQCSNAGPLYLVEHCMWGATEHWWSGAIESDADMIRFKSDRIICDRDVFSYCRYCRQVTSESERSFIEQLAVRVGKRRRAGLSTESRPQKLLSTHTHTHTHTHSCSRTRLHSIVSHIPTTVILLPRIRSRTYWYMICWT